MSILFEIRKRRLSARVRKRRNPGDRELKFLRAVATGDRRPGGGGSACEFCLLHGGVEPLLVDEHGTLMTAGKVPMTRRFEGSALKWKAAGYALTLRGAAVLRAKTVAETATSELTA